MKSINHTTKIEINVPISELFPLFSPEGEKYWVPGWDYENVMGTTELSEDYVFLTKTHDHGTTEAIWLVKSYDPNSHFVQFYKIEPQDKIGVITIKCRALELKKTEVQVKYKYIALSEKGKSFISKFTQSYYEEFINEWQKLLTNYFRLKS